MHIYHYTDANALISMVEYKKFWLSDFRFMNDFKEFHAAIEILGKIFHEEKDKKRKAFLEAIHKRIGAIYRDGYASYSLFDGYMIASFCKSNDILDMWRGYGQGLKYNIQINSTLLKTAAKDLFPDSRVELSECIYDENEKEQAVRDFLTKYNDVDFINHRGVDIVSPVWFEEFMLLALRLKNQGFSAEQEIRLIVKSKDNSIRKHRASAFGLTPYIELTLPMSCVSSIRVGPALHEMHVACASIMSLIGRSREIQQGIITGDCSVEISNISFR